MIRQLKTVQMTKTCNSHSFDVYFIINAWYKLYNVSIVRYLHVQVEAEGERGMDNGARD